MALKPHVPPTQKAKDERPREHILYVEDEDINWEIAYKRLSEKYNLERACNAQEAFQKIHDNHYDLVLMDIQLANSDFDGIACTKILRNRYTGVVPAYAADLYKKAPPIVFVTAYTARYTKEELKSYGADEMIAKPVDFIHLSLAMSRLIVRRQLGG